MYQDGTGTYRNTMNPDLDVKRVLEYWEWVQFRAGHDGVPAWHQSSWKVQINPEDDPSFVYLVAENNQSTVQEISECGTALCVAGYVTNDIFSQIRKLRYANAPREEVEAACMFTRFNGEEIRLISDYSHDARMILGLTDTEADALFHGDNTKEDIARVTNAILESRGVEVRVG